MADSQQIAANLAIDNHSATCAFCNEPETANELGCPEKGRLYAALLPGDIWDIEIPRAQQVSDVTVVLISSKSEAAYYEREEIAAAINLQLKGASQHRIVPVYLDRAAHERGEIPMDYVAFTGSLSMMTAR
jgi:hypothetical protein